jgi:hypothetical protein
LGDDFAREVLGVQEMRVNQLTGTTGFTLGNTQFVLGGTIPPTPSVPFDTLRSSGIHSGIEAFVLQNPSEAAYVAPPASLDTLHVDDWPVAVSRVYGSGQGRIVYLTFPLRGMNGSFSGHAGRPSQELQSIFTLFGM